MLAPRLQPPGAPSRFFALRRGRQRRQGTKQVGVPVTPVWRRRRTSVRPSVRHQLVEYLNSVVGHFDGENEPLQPDCESEGEEGAARDLASGKVDNLRDVGVRQEAEFEPVWRDPVPVIDSAK